MNRYHSSKINTVNVWNKQEKYKYNLNIKVCPEHLTLFKQFFIYEINSMKNGTLINKKLDIERLICNNKIISEKVKVL